MGYLSQASAAIVSGDDDPDPGVTLEEFFDPEFMADHSQFSSFKEFREESPWTITEWADFDEIDTAALDRFVAETTTFDNWRQLRNSAAAREARERLLV